MSRSIWFWKARPEVRATFAALFRQGKGVARDPRRALAWLERAAPQDPLVAGYELGQLVEGDGVAPDRARAEQLFRAARAAGHPEARRALRLLGVEV